MMRLELGVGRFGVYLPTYVLYISYTRYINTIMKSCNMRICNRNCGEQRSEIRTKKQTETCYQYIHILYLLPHEPDSYMIHSSRSVLSALVRF